MIGRQCNNCDSPFAEVTPSGCEGELGAPGLSPTPESGQTWLWGLRESHLTPVPFVHDSFGEALGCNKLPPPCTPLTAASLFPLAVLYDGCPKTLRAGVWWPQTKFGFSALVPCPKGSLGK